MRSCQTGDDDPQTASADASYTTSRDTIGTRAQTRGATAHELCIRVKARRFRPAGVFHRISLSNSIFADFMSDDATDGGPADRSDSAATRENGTPDGADPGANRRVLILCGHACAGTQTQQHDRGQGGERDSRERPHGDTSLVNVKLLIPT
jgi:hypothetical protein